MNECEPIALWQRPAIGLGALRSGRAACSSRAVIERLDTAFTIGPSHPAIPGHFPGRPVVPGVVVLDRVIAAAREAFGLPAAILPRVKFAMPVLPGQRVDVALTRHDATRITFTCTVGGQSVAFGELRLAP